MVEVGSEHSVLRRSMVLAWGAATGLLVLVVIFLGARVLRQQSSLAELGVTPEGDFEGGTGVYDESSLEEVDLYFGHWERVSLTSERRRLALGESTVANCRAALEGLIEGPEGTLTPVLPATTKVRGVYLLENGELVVDFSRDLESTPVESGSAELVMVQAVVNTLCQPKIQSKGGRAARSVRFLFEGSPAQESFPAHFDLSKPIYPDLGLIEAEGQGTDNV